MEDEDPLVEMASELDRNARRIGYCMAAIFALLMLGWIIS